MPKSKDLRNELRHHDMTVDLCHSGLVLFLKHNKTFGVFSKIDNTGDMLMTEVMKIVL